MPNTMIDAVISVVITGRRMQTSEIVMSGARVAARRHPGAVGQQKLAVGDHDVSPSSRPDSIDRHGRRRSRSTLTGRTVAASSLTTNTKVPAWLDLDRGRRNGDALLDRAASAACSPACPATAARRRSAWWRGSVTMPVAGSTVFSIIVTWPVARASLPGIDRLDASRSRPRAPRARPAGCAAAP